MQLTLNKNWWIEDDGQCYVLWNSRKQEDNEVVKIPIGYYSSIFLALDSYPDYCIKSTEGKTLKELKKIMIEVKDEIKGIKDQLDKIQRNKKKKI